MNINFFAILPLIACVIILSLGIFVFIKRNRANSAIFLSLFCFSMVIWLLGFTIMYFTDDPVKALNTARFGLIGILFIPILAYHFILSFLELNKKYKNLLLSLYLSLIPFLFISQTNLVYRGVKKFFWGFYPLAGKLYFLFLIMFVVLFLHGIWLLLKTYIRIKNTQRFKAEQIKYLLIAFGFGTLGVVDYIIKFDINIYPYGYGMALVFVFVLAYAIIRHNLMDIDLAWRYIFIKAIYTIFAVFILVIFIKNINSLFAYFLIVPIICLPLIYSWLNKILEPSIFGTILKDWQALDKLAKEDKIFHNKEELIKNLIEDIDDILHLQTTSFYTISENKLNMFYSKSTAFVPNKIINVTSGLVENLKNIEHPILKDTLLREQPNLANEYTNIMQDTRSIAICPVYVLDDLTGVLFLGEKDNKKMFNEHDLNKIKNVITRVEQNFVYLLLLELREQEVEKMVTTKFSENQLSIITSTNRLIELKDVKSFSENVVKMLSRILKIDYGSIYLLDDKNKEYTCMYKQGNASNNVYTKVKNDEYLLRYIEQADEPVWTSKLKEISENIKSKDFRNAYELAASIHGTLIIPIVYNVLLGFIVIKVSDTQSLVNFLEQDKSSFTMIMHNIKLALHNILYYNKSVEDSLTGVYNRRYLDDKLPQEIREHIKNEQELAYFMVDIDKFKDVNDTYSHDAGDVILREIAQYFKDSLRVFDIVCRYGGEEFGIVLPSTSLEDAYILADRLRLNLPVSDSIKKVKQEYNIVDRDITVSIGVSSFKPHKNEYPMFAIEAIQSEIMNRADTAMYSAKNTGRNKVCKSEKFSDVNVTL